MRSPSPEVVAAVEQAEREHPQRFIGDPCSCGYAGPLWQPHHRRVEVARATEAAALREAADECEANARDWYGIFRDVEAAGRELDGRTHDAMPGVAPC